MDQYFSLLGEELNNAESKLDHYKIKKTENNPPGSKNGAGKKRVIAVKNCNQDRVEIIWSYEEYT